MKNEEENHLGRPMPKGTVTLTAIDPDGDSQLLRRQDIDHTAKDEEIKLDLGRAFDVVYGYRMAESSRPALKQMICTCEFRIRNHKPYEIEARAVAEMSKRLGFWKSERRRDGRLRWVEEMGEAASWEIIRSTDRHVKHDHKTVHFDVRVPPDSEKTIRYTVDYRW